MLKSTAGFLLLSVAAAPAIAQCKVASGSHEGGLLAFHTVPMVFSFPMISTRLPSGSIRIGLEGDYLPTPSAELQRTSLCYVQKQENTSLATVFGRPRLTVSLPYGLAVEGSYVPEMSVGRARARSAGVALSYDVPLSRLPGFDGGDMILRGHWSNGTVRGPITCSSKELQQTSPMVPATRRNRPMTRFIRKRRASSSCSPQRRRSMGLPFTSASAQTESRRASKWGSKTSMAKSIARGSNSRLR